MNGEKQRKVRPFILVVTATTVLVVVLILVLARRGTIEKSPPISTDVSNRITQAASKTANPAPSNSAAIGNAPPTVGATAGTNDIQAAMQKEAGRKRDILSTYNDVPVDFYGRLEDQFGSPIAGADVKATIRIINGDRQGADKFATKTDANGLFEFHGKGQDIGIMPEKQGYTLSTTETVFRYSRLEDHPYSSTPGNPAVIKMWKLQGGEHLVHYQTQVRAPIAGAPVAFNLLTGQQVEAGGDIVVTVTSSSKPDVRQQYDWTVSFRSLSGGLIVSDRDFEQMFEAPKTGYEPQSISSFKAGDRNWTTTFNNAFYIMSRDGTCYGKLSVEVLSDVVRDGTVPLLLNCYLNPGSSRNLEIDPSLVSEAHP